MSSTRTKRRNAYSLVELLVVIAVITIVGLTSIPSIFNRNDRLALTTSANQLKQLIIDARTRSIAPDKNDSTGTPQQYQVVVGNFSQNANYATATVSGGIQTNVVSLEKGMAQCDSGDPQGGFSRVRTLSMPRGIYVDSFYPSLQQLPEDRAVIRFTVGQEGFICGGYLDPNLKSNTVHHSGWEGKSQAGQATVARYMVVTIGSSKIAEKRYVALDRITGEVFVSKTNPLSYFTPTGDQLAPKWTDITPANFTLSIACGPSRSTVTIGYPRANDLVDDNAVAGDPNLFVAYDISWTIAGQNYPLAINFFYELSESLVRYEFTTDAFTIANQIRPITVTVTAIDESGHAQAAYAGADDPLLTRQKVFNPTCGAVVSDPPVDPAPPPDPSDPPGTGNACNPIVPVDPVGYQNKGLWQRLASRFFSTALAKVPCM